MNKLYTKLAGNDSKFSRFPFIKVLSLTSIAALLSSVSPVFSKNLDPREEISTDIKTVAVAYPQSVISVYNEATGYLGVYDVSKDNYIIVPHTALTPNSSVLVEASDFIRPIDMKGSITTTRAELTPKTVGEEDQIAKGGVLGNPLVHGERAKGDSHDAIGYNAYVMEQVIEGIDVGANAKEAGKFAITLGDQAEATKEDSIAIGRMAHALGKSSTALGSEYNEKSEHGENDYTTAQGNYSTALGSVSKAMEDGATAVGHRAFAKGKQSISVGFYSKANEEKSVTLGDYAVTEVAGGVALGSASVSNVGAGVEGYSSLGKKGEGADFVWKSTYGAVSVGNVKQGKTRQIGGVAAGTEETDAVNIAQLKSLQTYVDKGWNLSVNGKDAKAVGINDTVDFAARSKNLEITKGEKDNNIKFDLAKNITLESVTAGANTLNAMGLVIANGPQITTDGINAGGKKITGVADGSADTDAVNFAQLKTIQAAAAIKGLKVNTTSNNFKDAIADGESSVAIGSGASASASNTVALGVNSQAKVKEGVALGAYSVADIGGAKGGYDPFTDNETGEITYEWKSTLGAVSVGNNSVMQSRQITGVAAGFQDTDAVNVAQLKSLRGYVDKGWKLSVDGKNAKAVGIDDAVDFAAGSKNFEITKGEGDNKVKFDLAKDITLGSVTTGTNTLDTTGLKIANGPQITTDGIHAGGKKITGVLEATNETDAVNFAQLQKVEKDVKEQVAANSFVKQDDKTRYITIGKNTDGDKIDITNTSGANRVISGVEDAKNDNDAVNKGQLDKGIENVSKDITNKFNDFTQSITNITQQVKGDALLWSESDDAFVAQHGEEKAKSKIKYLLNGDITAESTDAINGSQLYSMSNNLAGYFGSGAGYDENGEWKAPTFTLKTVREDGTASEESYDTVEKALSAVGTSFTNIQNKITNEITNEINKTKGDALLWSEADKAFVAQHGEGDKKADSKIMHLKAGDITAESTDAINGSQIYTLKNQIAGYFGGGAGYQNGEWKAPTFYVSQFKNDGNGDNKKSYDNVAAAFEGVNGSLSSINERINNVAKDITSSGLNWNDTEKAFDARHNGVPSKIKYVENGDVSKDSKEAVNGSQLFETNNRVSKVENRVDNIDQQIKNIENTVTNDAVKYDKDEKGDKINKVTFAGVSESDPVVLDNVAAGNLSKDSKQAVNGSQLWEANQKIDVVLDKSKKYTDERFNDIINHQMGDVINEAKSYTDMKFDALNYSIENVRKEAKQAAAIGLAVANLRYNDIPGKLSVGFGTGLWRSQSAFAFGAGYKSEGGSVLSNVSVTNSGGHWGIGAGFNMTLN